MAKPDQVYKIHNILKSARAPVSKGKLADNLECGERTVTRTLQYMRDTMDAPLLYTDRGWFYDATKIDTWELPGIWMTRDEVQSMLLLLDILNRFGNGLLNDELGGVRNRVHRMLEQRGIDKAELERRVCVVPVGYRETDAFELTRALTAIVERKQLRIRYTDFNGRKTSRNVSPQRLVYYRDNWYIHAWCHKKHALRNFSIARIERTDTVEEPAHPIPEKDLDDYFDKSYGMFAGKPANLAQLRFLPPLATEVARQHWHPDQAGRWDKPDYLLTIPYSEPTELLQDILRHMPYVIVEAPTALADATKDALLKGLARQRQGVRGELDKHPGRILTGRRGKM